MIIIFGRYRLCGNTTILEILFMSFFMGIVNVEGFCMYNVWVVLSILVVVHILNIHMMINDMKINNKTSSGDSYISINGGNPAVVAMI